MENNSVTFPELLRIAANCAEICLSDNKCIVKFDSRGVESIGDDKFIVNLAGAVLVKVFSHPTNKSYETHAGPAWQASLHEMSSGRIDSALNYAFGSLREAAPPEIISKLTLRYRNIGSGARSTTQKIAWVKASATAIEKLGEWTCASEPLEFKFGNLKTRERVRVSSHPFLETCRKIEELVGGENVLRSNVGWGDIDFFDVWQPIDRIQQIAGELSLVTSDDLSGYDAQRTLTVLETIFSTLVAMKEWDLTSENAASDRASYMHKVVDLERELSRTLQGWFPFWSSRRLEEKRKDAQETEERAIQAKAEASGEAASEIADAYEGQGLQAKNSRYLWTILSMVAAVGILVVNVNLMNGASTGETQIWSVQRIDSIITRFLSASVLGGIAYWAGRIATMRLREEAEHIHKALIARTLKGMKEGADTDDTRAQIDLIAHISLLHMRDQPQHSRGGPVIENPSSRVNAMISSAIKPKSDKGS